MDLKIKNFQYDLSPISVEDLLQDEGFGVLLNHWKHQLETYPRYAPFNPNAIKKVMKKEGYSDISNFAICEYFARKLLERSEDARSKIHLGKQIASNIGSLVENLAGAKVIGRESRLEERKSRDLDLYLTFYKKPSVEDVSLCLTVKKNAERKTKIPVDLLGNGIPVTEDSVEHLFGLFNPIVYAGFPVYWREQKYLDYVLQKKNEFFDRNAKEALKMEKELKTRGLLLGTIYL
jgi:hypothetical protein